MKICLYKKISWPKFTVMHLHDQNLYFPHFICRKNKSHRSTTKADSHRNLFLHSGLKNVVWWAFVSTFIALIFGQLSTDVSATNDVLSKGNQNDNSIGF